MAYSFKSKLLRIIVISFLLLTLLTVTLSETASAVSETSEQVAKRLQDQYHHLNSLSFLFFQTTKGQMTGRPKTGKGNAVFVRTMTGTKIRWNYTSPDRQVIISDGKTVSMYFENLNQMIISPVSDTQADILLSFFDDKQNITDSFTILDSDPDPVLEGKEIDSDHKIIYLVPKDTDSQIRTVHLWVTKDSHIRRIELIDHFETTTILNISEIKADTINRNDNSILSDIFTFTPPEGTEIIRQ